MFNLSSFLYLMIIMMVCNTTYLTTRLCTQETQAYFSIIGVPLPTSA